MTKRKCGVFTAEDKADLLRVQLESLGDALKEIAWEDNLDVALRDARDLAVDLLSLVYRPGGPSTFIGAVETERKRAVVVQVREAETR